MPNNAVVLEDKFRQAGIGDPTDQDLNPADNGQVRDLGELGGYRVCYWSTRNLLELRSIEPTPRSFIVFGMRLSHLKMACANAICSLEDCYPVKIIDLRY